MDAYHPDIRRALAREEQREPPIPMSRFEMFRQAIIAVFTPDHRAKMTPTELEEIGDDIEHDLYMKYEIEEITLHERFSLLALLNSLREYRIPR